MIYTGDILVLKNDNGDFDIKFENGQPIFTQGLETYVFLAVFGENYWGNALEKSDSAKMKSEFPGIIKRNVVSDQTKNDGTKAIEKILAPAIVEKIARKITVTGEIQTSFRIAWLIEIEAIRDKGIKYYINWEKGALTANLLRG